MLILFNDQVSVKDHCCQNKLDGEIYSSHVKCNFCACVFWPKLWLLWHYERILLSFITYITSSLSIDRSFPKKSTLRPYVISMMQKGCTFLWDFVYLNFNWHYNVSCVSTIELSVILSLIHCDAIFSQNRLFCLIAVSRSCNLIGIVLVHA